MAVAQEGSEVATARVRAVVVRALEVEVKAVAEVERGTVAVARVPGAMEKVAAVAATEPVGEVRAGEAVWVVATAGPYTCNKHPQQ